MLCVLNGRFFLIRKGDRKNPRCTEAYGPWVPGRTCCQPSPACGTPRATRAVKELFRPCVTGTSGHSKRSQPLQRAWDLSGLVFIFILKLLSVLQSVLKQPCVLEAWTDFLPPGLVTPSASLLLSLLFCLFPPSRARTLDLGSAPQSPHCERTVPRLLDLGAPSPS